MRKRARRTCQKNAIRLSIIAIITAVLCGTIVGIKQQGQTHKQIKEKQGEITGQKSDTEKSKYKVFDEMPDVMTEEVIEGFVYYELPKEYADKGYFPEEIQIYIRSVCEEYDVPYVLVFAMIERESGYEFDKIGDGGNSKGYMQIYEKWHKDRMQRLGCTDLMNPYENVRVGIDFISYLLKKYGTVQDALAAYNYGESGAREHLWNNGVYVYSYNREIMKRMKEIEEEVGK